MDRFADRRRDPAWNQEAKNLNEYDNLAASAYLRAKEDYLMGINFSRLLTFKIRQQYIPLSEYEIFCRIGRTCDDLCPWHGRAKRTGDPRVRRDAVLQSVKYNWRERFDVRGRMESGQRFKVVRIFLISIRKMDLRKKKRQKN